MVTLFMKGNLEKLYFSNFPIFPRIFPDFWFSGFPDLKNRRNREDYKKTGRNVKDLSLAWKQNEKKSSFLTQVIEF